VDTHVHKHYEARDIGWNKWHTYHRMQKSKIPTHKNKPGKTQTYTYIQTLNLKEETKRQKVSKTGSVSVFRWRFFYVYVCFSSRVVVCVDILVVLLFVICVFLSFIATCVFWLLVFMCVQVICSVDCNLVLLWSVCGWYLLGLFRFLVLSIIFDFFGL
jgi:hypothetical protein